MTASFSNWKRSSRPRSRDRASNSLALLCVEAAAADASAALEKCFALAEAILQTPATTLAGVMVKLRLQHFYFVESDGYAELLESVTADLERWTAPAKSDSPRRTLRVEGHRNSSPLLRGHPALHAAS